MASLIKGMIQVYTGDGKGKTTAALGLALRAIGHGLTVLMIQFLKGPEETGERMAARRLAPDLTILPMGRQGFVRKDRWTPEDRQAAQRAMDLAEEAIQRRSCDLLILDEINVACSFGLVPVEAVLTLMEKKPDTMELVLTGRNADPRILERADLVTEMKNHKHYFQKGVGDRPGIER